MTRSSTCWRRRRSHLLYNQVYVLSQPVTILVQHVLLQAMVPVGPLQLIHEGQVPAVHLASRKRRRFIVTVSSYVDGWLPLVVHACAMAGTAGRYEGSPAVRLARHSAAWCRSGTQQSSPSSALHPVP